MNIAAKYRALLGPAPPPPQRFTIPDLWARARAFVASMLAAPCDARTLISCASLNGAQRNAILEWLIPAERLVRQLLLVGAITHLMMTNQGRRIRAKAKLITPPKPPPPPPPPYGTTRMITIPLGATIARHYRYKPKRAPRPPVDPTDPDTWRTPFRVLRWVGAPSCSSPPPRRAAHPPAAASNLALARRVEALRRTLADTQAKMLRVARYLARLPRGLLDLPGPNLYRRHKPMTVLRAERFAMFELADRAVGYFNTS